MMPSKAVVLFSGTSAANTAISSGTLDTSDYDALLVEVSPSGAPTGGNLSFFDLGFSGSVPVQVQAVLLTGSGMSAAWGMGASNAPNSRYIGGLDAPVPASTRIDLDALGIGVTGTLRVIGRRNFRGPDRSSNPD